ncbi:hypothetical protein [Nocardioides sp. YIM 152315]|uniref:hypothetical protein n=1 Tax=Nocardioides sp. YIM 152315 TaxID=3031760 RepID=UPI0023DCD013|nr:hypothetical protein [Nocardioides sp. YIM 152315]
MVVAAALAAVAAGTVPGASAAGNADVTVRGTAFPPGNRAQLTAVGCGDVFQRSTEPLRPMIGLATGAGATGQRSLGFDTGAGTAAGVVSYVEAIGATTVAGVSVSAAAGTTGVAYVGYQAPADAGTSRMWIGRASLTVPASADWTTVDVPGLGYAWTQYDMATHRPTGAQAGSSGVPAFVQTMGGDGYGFYVVGFGCDGSPFDVDAWRIGRPGATTTYDLEGYGTRTSIAGPTGTVAAGQRVTLQSRVVDDLGAPMSGARVVLEAKQDDGTWETVRVAVGASVAVTLRVEETTTYRWEVFSTPSTQGSVSQPLVVTVEDPATEPSEEPTDEPTDKTAEKTADKTADGSSDGASEEPAGPAGEKSPTQQPAQQPASSAPPTSPPPTSAAPTSAAPTNAPPTAEPTPEPTATPTAEPPPASDSATPVPDVTSTEAPAG